MVSPAKPDVDHSVHAKPGDAGFEVLGVLTATDSASLCSVPVPVLEVDFGGVRGDRHYGVSRPSTSRQARFYPRGTLIRNRRQVSLVSTEELDQVAERLEVPQIRPEWLGANVLVKGLPQFSALPIGTRLLFPGGAGLVCEGGNQPCRLPAQVLQRQYPNSAALTRFIRAAFGRRGIVASVERPGVIAAGVHVRAFLPAAHATLD